MIHIIYTHTHTANTKILVSKYHCLISVFNIQSHYKNGGVGTIGDGLEYLIVPGRKNGGKEKGK